MAPCVDAASAEALGKKVTGTKNAADVSAAAVASGGIQAWAWDSASGAISLKSNASLCLGTSSSETYPLTLQACAGGTNHVAWKRGAAGHAQIVNTDLGECLDVKNDGDAATALGTWKCGSGSGQDQPNQHWAFDEASVRMSIRDESLFGPPPVCGVCIVYCVLCIVYCVLCSYVFGG